MGTWDQSRLDIVSDITSIPRPDASFDAVLCVEVFEHIPDPVAALREFRRLIRPGGRLILTAPFWSLTHYAPYHYSSGFDRYWYEYWLPRLGFVIDTIDLNGNWFESTAQELRRFNEMSCRFAGRKLGITTRLLIRLLLRQFERANRSDNGSNSVLCHGINILAHAKKDYYREPI